MNIRTDAIVMTVVLIAGFIYFKNQKEVTKSKEIKSDDDTVIDLNNMVRSKKRGMQMRQNDYISYSFL